MSSQGWSKQKIQTKAHKVENKQNALEKTHQEEKNNTRGGKKQKKCSNHLMAAKAQSKRRWKKEDKKRPNIRLYVKSGYVKDNMNRLHRRIYLFI